MLHAGKGRFLVGGLSTGYETDLLEFKTLLQRQRQLYVPQVNRIERTAEDT